MYTSIGIGSTTDPQEAHLYTSYRLAENEKKKQENIGCINVKIIEVKAEWPEDD